MKKAFQNIANNWFAFFAYLSLFLLMVIAAMQVNDTNHEIANRYNELGDKANAKLTLLINSRENVERIQAGTIDKVFHPSAVRNEKDQQLGQMIRQNDDDISRYGQYVEKAGEKEIYKKLRQAWQAHKESSKMFISLGGNEDKAIGYYRSTQKKDYDSLQNALSSLSLVATNEIKVKGAEANRFFDKTISFINLLIAIRIVILIVIGMIILKSIQKLRSKNRMLEETQIKLLQNQTHLLASQQISKTGSWELSLTSSGSMNGNSLIWSDETFRIFGYEPGEVNPTNDFFFSHIPADDKVRITEAVDHSLKTGVPYEIEHKIVLTNGEVKTIYERSDIFYDWQGNPVKMIGTCQDITAQKLANEKIESSEQLYRSLFNNGPLPKWVIAKNTLQILEVNTAAVEHYGYSKEEFLDMTVFDIRNKESHDEIGEMLTNGSFSKMKKRKVRHVKKNGEVITVEISVHPIQYKGTEALLGIAYDVTNLLNLQQELMNERVNKQIEITRATINAQEKERNELGKELHDNVNQILSTAKLFVESSLHNKDKQEELIYRGRDLINISIEELRKLSKTLEPPSLGGLTLKEAITELTEDYKQVDGKKIEVVLAELREDELYDDLKICIYRIIQEQLNNIRKYAEAAKVKIELIHKINSIQLHIEDNGKGFDIKAKRNGIGITNIINRAETYNGNIKINTEPGHGCSLYIDFHLDNIPSIEPAEPNKISA